ncbi:hypothetical protein AQUCO_01900127v1 [Aquilegia coerulea]|uniref:Protein argonaute 7 n=1 Tax=Aquilegia coerulea TaxID=218851 RepID=A0A2G5DJ03_AQUCA|nr:hypothetical protein AQUCO_01900127v1 [Aquilegia coerulea]
MSFTGDGSGSGSGSGGGTGRGKGRGRGKGSGRGSVSNVITPQLDSSLSSEIEAKLSIIETPPPASSKAMTFPSRPGYGTLGTKCTVRANHFLVKLQERDLHHYDVSITPEILSRGVNRAVMKDLVSQYRHSHLGGLQPVYDGRKGLFTAGPLPFTLKDFVIKLGEKDEQVPSRREREFKVVIKLATKTGLHHLQQFLSGRQRDAPQEIIQVLDIVLREKPSNEYTTIGRSFFSLKLGTKTDVGDGLECWRGYYQSLRPTQMGMSLNIDVAATAFYEAIPVAEYICKLLNIRDSSRPLTDIDRTKVKKALRGLRVEFTHRKDRRHHKISGITAQSTDQLMFTVDDSAKRISVSQYFFEKYGIRLRCAHWPALQVGTDSKPSYFPMEVCTIVVGQRYSKKLNEKQVTMMLRASCQRPNERERNISTMALHNDYGNDAFAKEFGINVDPRLVTIPTARVLQPPMLKYHDTGKDVKIQPRVGQWNMINTKMVNGGTIRHWTCVNFSSRSPPDIAFRFSQDLVSMCSSKGMDFNPNPQVPVRSARSDQIERTLVEIHNQSRGQLQLLIIILPDFSGSYGTIKRICETELGIISQCCQPKQAQKLNKQYLENVALKINAGGRNTVLLDALLRKIPLVSDNPTIIFGADVTHPSPGEDSSPSIAAVVASMDWPEVTKYRGLVSAQTHRQELIQDLYKVVQDPQKGAVHGGMIRELLIQFRRSTGFKPHRIIFYRDGVSEGQFNQVLLYELDAIRKACASLEEGYLPPVTFVVVQKRHHTRLFPADHGNRNLTDRSGNILPGTVVDTHICHPTEFDFYLCSHAGIQGTSRPTHYHVLWDENKFTADLMQTLTNNLCYTYARCTRSVSVVPPAYYAHLAAFRARYYIEGNVSESNTSPATRGINAEIRPLPTIKDNVKNVMFYC